MKNEVTLTTYWLNDTPGSGHDGDQYTITETAPTRAEAFAKCANTLAEACGRAGKNVCEYRCISQKTMEVRR